MKVIAKPIEMVAWFGSEGNINPVRFRITGEEGQLKVIKIEKILKQEKEKLAGNYMQVFTCTSIINGLEKILELKYEFSTGKWMLFKM